MDSKKDPHQIVEFERLNPAGKAVYIAGSAFKIAESVVNFTLTTLGHIWEETEKAFHEGVSDRDDAVILEETRHESTKSDNNPPS
jgi:hypothetical protein